MDEQKAMVFYTPWKHYTLYDLDRFDLGSRLVYIAQDRTCVFVANRHDGAARAPHHASEQELQGLWDEYRLIALLPVFRRIHSASRLA
jgi:hypothetical protein